MEVVESPKWAEASSIIFTFSKKYKYELQMFKNVAKVKKPKWNYPPLLTQA